MKKGEEVYYIGNNEKFSGKRCTVIKQLGSVDNPLLSLEIVNEEGKRLGFRASKKLVSSSIEENQNVDSQSCEKKLLFQRYSSCPDVTFWHELSKQKIENYKLSEEEVSIKGYYSIDSSHSNLPSLFCLEQKSFSSSFKAYPYTFVTPGSLFVLNTIESFKAFDKVKAFNLIRDKIWGDIVSGKALKDPSLLNQFLLVTFGDLKKFLFHYMFAFPVIKFPTSLKYDLEPELLSNFFNEEQLSQLNTKYNSLRGYSDNIEENNTSGCQNNIGYFILKKIENDIHVATIDRWDDFYTESDEIWFGIADSSPKDYHPGWSTGNALVLLAVQKAKQIKDKKVNLLFFRQHRKNILPTSFVYPSISIPIIEDPLSFKPEAVGWEKNLKRIAPKFVNLGQTMDPYQIAVTQTTLNLKLMKWRILPSLDLDTIANTRCLLVGSGTLGCNVARALLAWGVKNITFIDNGKVSFSNPARQSLYTYDDCLDGGKYKAVAAANALKAIYPAVNAESVVLSIPMPGHPIPDNLVEKTKEIVAKFEELVKNSDAIFLLTDSRESRWLPSLFAAYHDKICINSALGFDSYVVMRHGCSPHSISPEEERVGCYFCSDVVAPQDSLANRTLDQQCTVTRPGVSYIAGSLAVELLVSVLNHPLKSKAPADKSSIVSDDTSTPLGIVPHQMRGYLSHFNNTLVHGYAYDKCTACSAVIVDTYKRDGFDFLLNAFNNPQYLEDVSGLTEMKSSHYDSSIDWEEIEDGDDFDI